MRNPLPTNRLVALTLVGAIATAVVASALIVPGVIDTSADTSGGTPPAAASSDAPQPNQNFTAAVSNNNDGRDGEYEEYEEEEEEEYEEHEEEEYEEHEEYE